RSRPSTNIWRTWLRTSAADDQELVSSWGAAILIGIIAFSLSSGFEKPYHNLPPAYHDEFSYLFQAETYLQGRLSLPGFEPKPELFDQMHVLNEGRFASRYFPGVGLWMAPFVAMGNPILGHQLAQAICAMLLFWIGRELTGNGVGLLSGLLFALSPGMILFSTLLLSHHPTLVGLLLFLWAFLKWMRCGHSGLLPVAGSGLAFAMICRPMTAAGFGLPFGLLFLFWWLTGKLVHKTTKKIISHAPITESMEINKIMERHFKSDIIPFHSGPTFVERTVSAILLGLPLIIAGLFQMETQRQITGSAFLSPYQQYTDIYTPRHRYGFNNVTIGEQHLGPKVLDNYDRWAENLTSEKAIQNVGTRLLASMRWTFGIIPLTASVLVVLFTPKLGNRRWWFIPASIVSLHIVHIPYWFTGIMDWHYVLETAPLWLLIFAEATSRLERTWVETGAYGLRLWWRLMIATVVAVNLVTVVPIWPGRLPQGLAEVTYPRGIYGQFRQQIEEQRQGKDAIVFVIPDPADRHMDLIVNPPTLDGPVLVARLKHRSELEASSKLFPDRLPLLYDAARRQWEPVSRSTP
ncbi:MAG TPA: hypothetical protein VNQ76_12480, partial [Planctomicrobium sp.]|nr:hypothetical protein [Planctomicrobium sp.]